MKAARGPRYTRDIAQDYNPIKWCISEKHIFSLALTLTLALTL
eukprot:CAMPEP_0119365796 /NCGR_PEP_ID=MMETSP1334-20130426/12700_1 /TAXON_ID=127549 /ORGANISM="Calcidiscus leptoporus, Strain RCC1130" /LENGTH=42 /DNA_ID= /DNA_START= /DNA_END= /DNA_ORIENTATION=